MSEDDKWEPCPGADEKVDLLGALAPMLPDHQIEMLIDLIPTSRAMMQAIHQRLNQAQQWWTEEGGISCKIVEDVDIHLVDPLADNAWRAGVAEALGSPVAGQSPVGDRVVIDAAMSICHFAATREVLTATGIFPDYTMILQQSWQHPRAGEAILSAAKAVAIHPRSWSGDRLTKAGRSVRQRGRAARRAIAEGRDDGSGFRYLTTHGLPLQDPPQSGMTVAGMIRNLWIPYAIWAVSPRDRQHLLYHIMPEETHAQIPGALRDVQRGKTPLLALPRGECLWSYDERHRVFASLRDVK